MREERLMKLWIQDKLEDTLYWMKVKRERILLWRRNVMKWIRLNWRELLAGSFIFIVFVALMALLGSV